LTEKLSEFSMWFC